MEWKTPELFPFLPTHCQIFIQIKYLMDNINIFEGFFTFLKER